MHASPAVHTSVSFYFGHINTSASLSHLLLFFHGIDGGLRYLQKESRWCQGWSTLALRSHLHIRGLFSCLFPSIYISVVSSVDAMWEMSGRSWSLNTACSTIRIFRNYLYLWCDTSFCLTIIQHTASSPACSSSKC